MISVLINWIYVFIVTFILGRFVLTRAYKLYGYERNAVSIKTSSAVAAGLAVTTVYAGFFSVIYKVGIVANLIMIFVCVALIFIDRGDYSEIFSGFSVDGKYSIKKYVTNLGVWKIILLMIIFVATVFFTTEGQFFSDSGLYHEQSIRWIEEFGTVKGSCHVLKRLAYNSSYFAQCALFSMRDLWGQSLHCLGGFYAIFVMTYAVVGFDNHIKTNTIRMASIIYFVLFCSEIISPASDFPLVYLIIYVAVRWSELLDEKRDNEYAPYALLSLFVVFIISIKLTVGCLVLIVIKPAITMIKEKKVKEIVISFIAGFTIIVPYFIRNYLICGWLIYPFTAIDIFNPKWKMLSEYVQGDADEIKIWGRGMGTLGGQVSDGINVWLPHWWEYLSGPDKRIIGTLGIVAALFILYRFVKIVLSIFNGRFNLKILMESSVVHNTVFEVAILASILFWFVEAPLFRYGIAYILVVMTYMLGDMLEYAWGLRNRLARYAGVVVALLAVVPMLISIKDYLHWDYECIRYYSDYRYFVLQEDYPRVEYATKEIDGILFYYPAEEMGQIGYHIFPAIWSSDIDGVKRLGEDIKDGFMSVAE